MINRADFGNQILNNVSLGIVAVDTEGKLIFANNALLSKLGYNTDDITELKLWSIIQQEDVKQYSDNFQQILNSQVDSAQCLTRFVKRDHNFFLANLMLFPVIDNEAKITCILGILNDFETHVINTENALELRSNEENVSDKLLTIDTEYQKINQELQIAYKKLEEIARTDTLTNLSNRRQLEEQLQIEVNRTRRTKREFSICICDIDNFKKFNDNYGHDVGDIVLKEISEILRSSSRNTDVVGRWGGEEFMFILPETHLEGAIGLMERVRLSVEAHKIKAGDKEFSVTVSLGASSFYADSQLEIVIKQADLALYAAKKSGKNLAVMYKKQLEVVHSIYID